MRTPKEEDNKQITHVINLCVMLVRVGIYKGTTAGTPQHQGKGTYITSSIKAVTQQGTATQHQHIRHPTPPLIRCGGFSFLLLTFLFLPSFSGLVFDLIANKS